MASPASSTTATPSEPPGPGPQTLHDRIAANLALPTHTTLRHLARALRDNADPNATLALTLPYLEQQYALPGSHRTQALPPSSSVTEQTSPLCRLPRELLLAVRDALDPASTICLAQTCATLRREIDCALPDLKRFCLAWVFDRRVPGKKLRAHVFRATEMLDRDRLVRLEAECALFKRMYACSVCISPHPASAFPCRASQTPIPLAPGWTETLTGLRHWRRALLTASYYPDPYLIIHPGAHTTGSPSSGPCTLRVNSRDELVLTRRIPLADGGGSRAQVLARAALALVSSHREVFVCLHVKAGMLEEGTAGGCRRCGTSWVFAVERVGEGGKWRAGVDVRVGFGDLKSAEEGALRGFLGVG